MWLTNRTPAHYVLEVSTDVLAIRESCKTENEHIIISLLE